jgi:hypothetical protein
MKILYVSPKQGDASLRQACSEAGAGVVLSSAQALDEASRWIFNNLDLAALILDAEFGLPQCASFLKNLRGRGLSVPVILMASDETGRTEDLSLSADDCILPKDLLLTDLGGAVKRAAYAARPSVAFAVLADHVVEIYRHLERTEREHDLRLEIGDLRAAQTALQEHLTRTEAALHESNDRQTEASQSAARREKELLDQVREDAGKQAALARLLQDEQRARNEADDTLKRERLTIAEQIARLEQRLASSEAERANTVTIKDALERRIAEQHAAGESVRQALESKTATLERLGERQREFQTLLVDATNSRDALAHELAISESSLRAAEQRALEQRVAALTAEAQLETRVADERSRRAALERELQDARSAAADTRHQLLDRIDAMAAERLQELAALSDQRAQERKDHQASLTTMRERVRQLEIERDTLSDNTNGDQIRQVQSQLEEIAQRVDREFDAYPLPLCRATRAGAITRANRAFGALLGCPLADATRLLNLASESFDSSNELAWLVERSASSGDVSSVECTRRKVDGSRLVLRLSAMPVADAIHIIVEDLTPNWMLQERLSRAQQMEAVGRMAAEVALTCVNFLNGVTEDGRRLIATLEDGSQARRSGEQMLGGVDRVATSLRQLADYADDQAAVVNPVDLHQVLHDLEPILQELAGDDVQVVLPARPPQEVPPFNVDATPQRVERLLINLAWCSRERISSGGQMIFDVAFSSVDGQFVAEYPNVRRGPYALLTVTEAKGADGLAPGPRAHESTAERTDVDFSALHGLVRHCGGHLSMDTDPTGEMKIKVHLPLRAA